MEGVREFSGVFFIKALIPCMRHHPHDLFTSQSPHFLLLSPWHLQLMNKDCHLWILRAHEHSVHCTLQSSKIHLTISASITSYIIGTSFSYETPDTPLFPGSHSLTTPLSPLTIRNTFSLVFSLSSPLLSSVALPKAAAKAKILSKPMIKIDSLARHCLWYNWDTVVLWGFGGRRSLFGWMSQARLVSASEEWQLSCSLALEEPTWQEWAAHFLPRHHKRCRSTLGSI